MVLAYGLNHFYDECFVFCVIVRSFLLSNVTTIHHHARDDGLSTKGWVGEVEGLRRHWAFNIRKRNTNPHRSTHTHALEQKTHIRQNFMAREWVRKMPHTHTLREEKSSARYSKREGVTKIDLKYFFSSRAANARAKNVNIWLAFSVFTMCFSFTFFDLLFFEHILFSAIQFSFYFLFFVTGPARCGWSYVCQHTTPHHTTQTTKCQTNPQSSWRRLAVLRKSAGKQERKS